MQDEINEKVVALSVKGAKLTAEMLQKAIKAMLAQAKKQQEKQPHGKQTLKQLAKQNAGLSNIEITEGNIKAFEQTAKKYGIDFALKKDSTETPPRYLVFFKGRDADALTAAFKEFSAKKLTQEQTLPNLHGIGCGLFLFQKQVKFVHVVAGRFFLGAVYGNAVPHLVLHNEHT